MVKSDVLLSLGPPDGYQPLLLAVVLVTRSYWKQELELELEC